MTRCRHCGRDIRPVETWWVHADTLAERCTSTLAEPEEA